MANREDWRLLETTADTHMAETQTGELSALMELIWGSMRDDLEQRLLVAGLPADVVASIRLEPNSMGTLALQSEPHLGLLWRKREAEALAMARWLIGNSASESETFRKIESKLEDFINARDEASTLGDSDRDDWANTLLARAAFDDARASQATRELLVKAGELMAFGETLPPDLATFVGERLQRLRQKNAQAWQALGVSEPVKTERSVPCDAILAASYYYLLKVAKPQTRSKTQWSANCAKVVSAAFDCTPTHVRRSARGCRALVKLSADDLRPLLKGNYTRLKKAAQGLQVPLGRPTT